MGRKASGRLLDRTLLLSRSLDLKGIHSWRNQVEMSLDIMRNVILVASNVQGFGVGMLIDVIFCRKKRFELFDSRLEFEPAAARRYFVAIDVDSGSVEPVSHGSNGFTRRSEEVSNFFGTHVLAIFV